MVAREGRVGDRLRRPSRGSTCSGGGSSNGEYFPVEQMAERTADGVSGRADRVRPVPQAPVRPLDAGRLPRRSPTSSRTCSSGSRPRDSPRRPACWSSGGRSDPAGIAAADSPDARGVRLRRPLARLADPATGRPLPPRALGGPELPAERRPPRAALRLADPARTTRTSPAASSTASGPPTSASGWSIRSTASRSPTRPRTRAARRAGGRLRRARVRHPPAGADDPRLAGLPAVVGAGARATSTTAATSPASVPRTMMAEVLVDALNAALGVAGDFGSDAPKGARAIEIAANRVASPDLARVFRDLRPAPSGSAICDCERPGRAGPAADALPHDRRRAAREDQRPAGSEGPARLGPVRRGDRRGAVPRHALAVPDDDERAVGPRPPSDAADRKAAMTDVLWALINTREFVLNH